MSLPIDIQFHIINFILPELHLLLVCKNWSNNILNIKKSKAVYILSNWYFKNRFLIKFANPWSLKDLFRGSIDILSLPEHIVNTWGLSSYILNILPNHRKKSDVRKWLLQLPSIINKYSDMPW